MTFPSSRTTAIFAPGRFWTGVGRQLGHPTGVGGRVAGALMARINRAPYAAAIDFLEVAPDDRILEVGFGPGEGLAALAALAPRGHVSGVDRSAEMMAVARGRNAAAVAAGRMTLDEGSADSLPWPDCSFDKALGVNVAYFFGADGGEMRELHRVLKPGGGLVLYATDAVTMRGWPFAHDATHRRLYAGDLRALFRDGGFDDGNVEVLQLRLAMGVRGLVGRAIR